jgi:hypothetical protein
LLTNPSMAGNVVSSLELSGVKDDGNDMLRPKMALACEYIDHVHRNGGKTLVHCVSLVDVATGSQ